MCRTLYTTVVCMVVLVMACIPCNAQSQDNDKNFAVSCPDFSKKSDYYNGRFRKIGEMAGEGIKNGNTPAEICKVLNEQVSFFGEMLSDMQTCRPYKSLELNDFATSVSSQLALAQQQRQGLGCR